MKFGCNPNSMTKTRDNGCVIAGVAYKDSSLRTGEAFLSKFDSSGTLQWAERIGDSLYTSAYSVIQTKDNGYIFCGMLFKWDSIGVYDQDVYVVKLDSSGKIEWSQAIGTRNDEYGLSILQTFDGGYIIVGKSIGVESRGYIIRLRNNGFLEWTRTIGGGSDYSFNGNAIVQLKDSNFIVTGERYDIATEVHSIYLLKMSNIGNVIWSRELKARRLMSVSSIIQAQDNSIVLCGSILDSNNRYSDFYTARFDTAGNLIWGTSIDALGNASGYSIMESSMKEFIISGTISTNSYGASVLSLDANGHLKWMKSIAQQAIPTGGGPIAELSDQGLIVLGGIMESNPTRYSGFITKLDKDGNGCNTLSIQGVERHIGILSDTTFTVDSGGIVTPGFADSISFGATTSDFCSQDVVNATQSIHKSEIPIFPNPVIGTYISIALTKMLSPGNYTVILRDDIGREVFSMNVSFIDDGQDITIPVKELPSGYYSVVISKFGNKESLFEGKFLKTK